MPEEKLNPTVQKIADWVQTWIDYSDAEYCRKIHREGRDNERTFENMLESSYRNEYGTKHWEEVSKEELNRHYFEKLDYNFWNENNIGNLEYAEINGEKISIFDFEKVNEVLNPLGYFYAPGKGIDKEWSFLIAKIEKQTKENGFDVYMLGEELARDMDNKLSFSAFVDFENKEIYARKESSKYLIWNQLAVIRNPDRSPITEKELEMLKEYTQKMIKSRSEEVQKESPENLEEKVKKASEKLTDLSLHHELGHGLAYENIQDHDKYLLLKKINNYFIRAISDVFADTIKIGNLNGSFAHIENLRDDEDREALLGCLSSNYITYEDYSHQINKYMQMLAPEFENLYDEYMEKKDVSTITKAREKVFNRTKELADEICEQLDKGDEGSIRKIISDFEKQYEGRVKND